MTTALIALGVATYAACCVLTWGFYCGYHRKAEYRWLRPNYVQLVILTLSGPLGLLTEVSMGEYNAWSWYPATTEERWQFWIDKGYGDSPEDRREFEGYQTQ
jgi:hypothetical protein